VVNLSPELLIKIDTYGSIFTSPIKGTRPRGASPARLAQPGTVRLAVPPHVEAHGKREVQETLWKAEALLGLLAKN